jgi:hypothetical protein
VPRSGIGAHGGPHGGPPGSIYGLRKLVAPDREVGATKSQNGVSGRHARGGFVHFGIVAGPVVGIAFRRLAQASVDVVFLA